MQHLLCIQDEKVKRLKGEALKGRETKILAEKLVVESLQKEITMGKDLETLCNKTIEFSEVRAQLEEVKAEVERLRGKEVGEGQGAADQDGRVQGPSKEGQRSGGASCEKSGDVARVGVRSREAILVQLDAKMSDDDRSMSNCR